MTRHDFGVVWRDLVCGPARRSEGKEEKKREERGEEDKM